MSITAVYFDLGGVVFHYDPEIRLKRMAERSGIGEDLLQQKLFDSGFSEQCDAGAFSAEEMHARACEILSWHPPYRQFQQLWLSVFQPNTEVIGIARTLSQSLKVGMLTNNPPILRQGLSDLHPEVEAIFDPIIFSAELKIKKPDPAIYRQAIERIRTPAREILFIDDTEKYLQAARTQGIHTIHYSTTAALEEALSENGLLPPPAH